MAEIQLAFCLPSHASWHGVVCVRAKPIQSCPVICDAMDCSQQVPLLMGFSRQDSPPALAGGFFTARPTWEVLAQGYFLPQKIYR